jgi:putative transposase
MRLVVHSDHGSEFLSLHCTTRLVEVATVRPSGGFGDVFDCARDEDVSGLYMTEGITRQRLLRGLWRME